MLSGGRASGAATRAAPRVARWTGRLAIDRWLLRLDLRIDAKGNHPKIRRCHTRAAPKQPDMMARALALASLPALVFSHGAMVTPRSRNSVVRPRRPPFPRNTFHSVPPSLTVPPCPTGAQRRPPFPRNTVRSVPPSLTVPPPCPSTGTGLARRSAEERWPRRDNLGLVPERHG